MAVFTIPEASCTANAATHSPTATMPAGLKGINVSLTSTQWSDAPKAGKLVLWGVVYSTDGGATWGPGLADNTSSNTVGGASLSEPAWVYQTDVVGNFGRGGVKGLFAFSGGNMPPAGTLVRLFVWPTITMNIGVVITTS